jgi:hypothetical protein
VVHVTDVDARIIAGNRVRLAPQRFAVKKPGGLRLGEAFPVRRASHFEDYATGAYRGRSAIS